MNPICGLSPVARALRVFFTLVLFAWCNVHADTTFIASGATWKYLDNGSDQGTGWRAAGFPDAAWASGPAELGYGDAAEGRPEATIVSYGSDPNNKHVTTYFRRHFDVIDASQFASLKLRVIRDDGVIVYLNGQEIWRDKMPAGTVNYRTLATVALGGIDESTFVDVIVPSTQLVSGHNVIAAEIHQANVTSSDISFNLELIGLSPGLRRHPYLQMGTPTGVTVRWRTDVATDSVVRFGSSPTSLTREVRLNASTPTTEHEVPLTGLAPDTRYYYSVGSSTFTYSTGEANVFFTSPPAQSSQPTRIWVIGDAGTGTANQLAVRDAFYNFAPGEYTDVMLMLGDNVYETGTDAEFTARHFSVYSDFLRQTVSWPTIGNHDTGGLSNPSPTIPYYQSFTLPTRGEAGGVPSGTEDYYSFDFGDIHFICLDSMTESRATTGPMATWLRQDLANTTQRWVIAYWHHPAYSKGHNSDTDAISTEMRTNFVPLLEEYGVDLVLAGHTHAYERSYLLNGHYGTSSTLNPATMIKDGSDGRGTGGYNKPTLDGAGHEGAVYAVAGSSGKIGAYAGITDTGTGNGSGHPAMFISWERLGSMVIDIDGHRLDARFLRENGTVADTFTITKGPRVNAPPLVSITSPSANAQLTAGGPTPISASASDSDQGLEEVVFYANSSRIGAVAASGQTSSFGITWTPPAAGNYRLHARAVDLLGKSTVSDPVDVTVTAGGTDTTPPGPITNLTASPAASSVLLAWRAPGDDGDSTGSATTYDVRYSTTDPASDLSADKANWWAAATQASDEPLPAAAGTTQEFAVTGLSAGITYYSAIKSSDEAGNTSGISNIAVATTPSAPAPPSNLTATAISRSLIRLGWTDASSNEAGFVVERASGNRPFAALVTLGANAAAYDDAAIAPGKTYTYRVKAVNAAGDSAYSNSATATTPRK